MSRRGVPVEQAEQVQGAVPAGVPGAQPHQVLRAQGEHVRAERPVRTRLAVGPATSPVKVAVDQEVAITPGPGGISGGLRTFRE